MKHFAMAVLTYSAAVCQSGLGRGASTGMPTPGLMPVALGVAVLVFEGRSLIVWAALIGLTADALRPEYLGIGMLAATAAAVLAETIVRPRAGTSVIAWTVAVFALVFAVTFGTRFAAAALGGRVVLSTLAMENAVVTAGCAASIVALLAAARRMREREARLGSTG